PPPPPSACRSLWPTWTRAPPGRRRRRRPLTGWRWTSGAEPNRPVSPNCRSTTGPADPTPTIPTGAAMTNPPELRHTPEHEWVAVEGPVASVGITDYAQRALGDVVYVSVPAPGTRVTAGEPCGEVESTKSVSDIYSPVNGEVAEVNGDVD